MFYADDWTLVDEWLIDYLSGKFISECYFFGVSKVLTLLFYLIVWGN